jgi:carbonic anhydrase
MDDNELRQLFDNNRAWARRRVESDPAFFRTLAAQQSPRYLWIGCADSRVPANEIVGLLPGEVFVHRNIANVVVHTDLNCLSVLQYGVEVLRIEHVIVVGHYGCGGVTAVVQGRSTGLADNWLRHVEDVALRHRPALAAIANVSARIDRLCELNVIEQVLNVCRTTIVRDAWARGSALRVHGWVYGLDDGRLRDLCLTVGAGDDVEAQAERVVAALGEVPLR